MTETEEMLPAVQEQLDRVEQAPGYLACLAALARHEVQAKVIEVTSDALEQYVVDERAKLKEIRTQFEELRQNAVRVPNAFVRHANKLFKEPKHACDTIVEQYGTKIQQFRRMKEARLAKETAEQTKAIEAQSVEDYFPPTPPKQENVTRTASGSKAFEREMVRFEIVDVAKLLKAALDPRMKVPFDVAKVDEVALRRHILGDEIDKRAWKNAGVKVWKEKVLV